MEKLKRYMADGKAGRSRRWVVAALIVFLFGAADRHFAEPQAHATGRVPSISLSASEVLRIARSLGSGDPYDSVAKVVLQQASESSLHMTAFEESRFFIYAVGDTAGQATNAQSPNTPGSAPRIMRRVIILKPSVFVVDDEVIDAAPRRPIDWWFEPANTAEAIGRINNESGWKVSCETLYPQRTNAPGERAHGENPRVESTEVFSLDNSGKARFLHFLEVRPAASRNPRTRSELTTVHGQWKLKLWTEDRIVRLTLPPPDQGAGEIAVSTADGKPLLANQPLAAGILPHGPEGVRLMEQWDADYQGKRPPAWDIGKPADELQKAVSEGKIHPCRAVDLCCGSGTDAIYLARKGFQVTALDIAPTALSLGERKARAAGVSAAWLLANVLAPPNLVPFDFIYDRGCYHVVRDQNLNAYLDTLRHLSRPGTQFLLLAARADEEGPNRNRSGVTEEELRFDLLPLFDIEWLRQIRLESNEPGIGPPGWAALLRRSSKP